MGVENVEVFSDGDREFLAALAGGATVAGASHQLGYSSHWGKWKSRSLRRRLGVETIWEAVAMAEDDTGVSRADFDKLTGLVSKLGESIDDLARRPTDQGRQEVKERELSVKELAEKLGLTPDDVERVKGEKEYERFKAMQQRLADESAEEVDPEEEPENGGVGQRILDGLGGIRNVKPS